MRGRRLAPRAAIDAGCVDDQREQGGSAERRTKGPRAALDFEDEDGGYAPPPDDDGDPGGGGFTTGRDFPARRRRVWRRSDEMTLDALGSSRRRPRTRRAGTWTGPSRPAHARGHRPRLAAAAPPLTGGDGERPGRGGKTEARGGVDGRRACDRGGRRMSTRCSSADARVRERAANHGEIVVAAGSEDARSRVGVSAALGPVKRRKNGECLSHLPAKRTVSFESGRGSDARACFLSFGRTLRVLFSSRARLSRYRIPLLLRRRQTGLFFIFSHLSSPRKKSLFTPWARTPAPPSGC